MPDSVIFPGRLANDKYLIGELLVLSGCLVILGNHGPSNALSLLMPNQIPAWLQSFPDSVLFGAGRRLGSKTNRVLLEITARLLWVISVAAGHHELTLQYHYCNRHAS